MKTGKTLIKLQNYQYFQIKGGPFAINYLLDKLHEQYNAMGKISIQNVTQQKEGNVIVKIKVARELVSLFQNGQDIIDVRKILNRLKWMK